MVAPVNLRPLVDGEGGREADGAREDALVAQLSSAASLLEQLEILCQRVAGLGVPGVLVAAVVAAAVVVLAAAVVAAAAVAAAAVLCLLAVTGGEVIRGDYRGEGGCGWREHRTPVSGRRGCIRGSDLVAGIVT